MQWHGVNLGGWLVLERWITPSVFKGTMVHDEYGLCQELGPQKQDRMEQHRKSFITEADFEWLSEHDINAVRLPIPHWLFGDVEPFVGCAEYVTFALGMAQHYQLKVLLDIHTAPGSQNGQDHSGQQGSIEWHKRADTIEQSVLFIAKVAQTFGSHPALLGIELLNEPSSKIPRSVLLDYYQQAAKVAREHTSVPLSISDAYQPEQWGDELTDMWLDMHLYQIFSADDKRRPIHRIIKKAKYEWADELARIQATRPVIIGEWSLSLNPRAFRGMDDFERDKALQAYGRAQLEAFNQASGWFYWTYKTEDQGTWSYRDAVQRGWLDLSD